MEPSRPAASVTPLLASTFAGISGRQDTEDSRRMACSQTASPRAKAGPLTFMRSCIRSSSAWIFFALLVLLRRGHVDRRLEEPRAVAECLRPRSRCWRRTPSSGSSPAGVNGSYLWSWHCAQPSVVPSQTVAVVLTRSTSTSPSRLLGVDAAFLVDHRVAMEAGGDLLLGRRRSAACRRQSARS